jgi:hypothetical protein
VRKDDSGRKKVVATTFPELRRVAIFEAQITPLPPG